VGVLLTEALVRARLDTAEAAAPTRVYGQPFVLYLGQTVAPDRIGDYLEFVGYERVGHRPRLPGQYQRRSTRLSIAQRGFRHLDRMLTGGAATVRFSRSGRVTSIDTEDDGQVDYLVLEPPLLRTVAGRAGEDRVPVPLDQVPDDLQSAVLAVEDQRFYAHHGIDLIRIAGAAVANVRAGRLSQGGSTITQQLVKNRFLTPKRTLVRKVRELVMAVVLEARYSKETIFEAYLNEIYFGQQGRLAIHGVGRAAQFYFGADVSTLDLSQSALLAGMIRGPSLYNPRRHPERAQDRRDLVLGLMREQERADPSSVAEAIDAPLTVREPLRTASVGRHFTDFVLHQLRDSLGAAVRHGHAVFTSMQIDLQVSAEDAVRDGLRALEREYPQLLQGAAPLEAALVALDPRTGGIVAMVGGRDYGRSQFNRAVLARRQPGSAFKPIVALAALADGAFTLATSIEDEPLSVETPAGVWQPTNYDEQFRGNVTLRDALERSLNVPMARVGLATGPERIVATARAVGIDRSLPAVPSIALGAAEVSPLELTRAYGVLAAEGVLHETHGTIGVMTPGGGVVATPAPEDGRQVVDERVAYLVTSALQGVVDRGTGRGVRRAGFRGTVAAKSGTTNDFRDAWFVGYTPSLVVGVWVGFDDGTPVELPGARAALPIFARFLTEAEGRRGQGHFRTPPGIDRVEIDPETGLRAGPGCRGRMEVFLRGTAPRESCSPYRLSWDRRTDRGPVNLVELLRRRFLSRPRR
jgi:penicillin-binding protein 1B